MARVDSLPSQKRLDILYHWFAQNQRDLPFRKERSPYKTWISETMLQQTRVQAMLPAFENFMKAFPDVHRLANAEEESVITHWQGLGYYSRAKNLHQTAKILSSEYHGDFPTDRELLLHLPGIGPYTANAILSLGFEKHFAVFDGNVNRVLSRLYYPTESKDIPNLADELLLHIGKTASSFHNESLMEFGAMVCIPKAPKCLECPLKSECGAFQKGGASLAAVVPPIKKQDAIVCEMQIFIMECKGRFLVLRSKKSRFLRNLWALPYSIDPSIGIGNLPQFSQSVSEAQAAGKFRHTITKYKIQATVLFMSVQADQADLGRFLEPSEFKWISFTDLKTIPAALNQKAIRIWESKKRL